MRVVCIDDDWYGVTGYELPKVNPKYGEILTVTEAATAHPFPYYCFSEYGENRYEQCGFIPISDIDETQMEREYNKEKVF
jgi:hypothetical protein